MKYKLFAILGALAVIFVATPVFAYQRTITDPATNSSLSSAVMRAQLQALENEITSYGTVGNFTFASTSAWTLGSLTVTGTCTGCGSASTTLFSVFNKAYFGATATTTIDSTGSVVLPSAATLTFGGITDKALATNVSGTTYGVATGTVSAGSGIALDNATRQVFGGSLTITNTIGYPFVGDATSTLINFSTGLRSASTTLTGPFVFGSATGTNATTTSSFATTASSTNLFGANLLSCNSASSALTWNAGKFGCNSIASAAFSYPFAVNGLSTTSPIELLASTTIGGGTVPTGLTVNGTATTTNFIDTSLTSVLALFDANHKETAYAGSNPCTNQVALSISASGVISCTSVTNAMLSNSSVTVTAGTGLNGGGSVALGASITLNSSIAYPFTASNGTATTSPIMLLATTTIGAGGQATGLTVNGQATTTDTINNFVGPVLPTYSFVLQTGTTTSWTASTTGTGYSPSLVMPFAGILKQSRCYASSTTAKDQSFLGVNVQVNGANATPSYFVSSSTVGLIKYTAGNTFTAGQIIIANFGTTTSSSAVSDACTFDYILTP